MVSPRAISSPSIKFAIIASTSIFPRWFTSSIRPLVSTRRSFFAIDDHAFDRYNHFFLVGIYPLPVFYRIRRHCLPWQMSIRNKPQEVSMPARVRTKMANMWRLLFPGFPLALPRLSLLSQTWALGTRCSCPVSSPVAPACNPVTSAGPPSKMSVGKFYEL